MAKVVYKKYEAKNLNPNYKMVEEAASEDYKHSYGYDSYRDFAFNSNTGDYTLSNKTKPQDAIIFYQYYGMLKNLIVKYKKFNYVNNNGYTYEAQLVYKSEPVPPKYTQGAYVGEIVAEDGRYPRSGEQDGYWYEWDRFANTAPRISGEDLDLGAQFKDFQVEYIIQDNEGDDVTVAIKIDDVIKQPPTKTTLGVRRYFVVPVNDYDIGRHTIEIKATDTRGASTVRSYTFNKVNSAPIISGQDTNLGPKNTAFTYTYTVTDNENDNVDVVEKLNGDVIRVLNNAALGSEHRITISDEQIRKLDLNTSNTLEIEVTDGAATTFRRVTFIRNNIPPIISDRNKDLGDMTNSLEYSWSATDPEKDKMTAVVYLDDRILKDRHAISDGANQTIKIDSMDMFKIGRGKHTIRIVVEDDKGFSSTRTLTFTRVVNRLVMKLAGNGIETDELASRVLISTAGIQVAKGADVKYEVCNNSFDDSPIWEDATTMTLANRAFNFVNDTKTADKAGVDIKVTITRGDAKSTSYISAIGGSFD